MKRSSILGTLGGLIMGLNCTIALAYNVYLAISILFGTAIIITSAVYLIYEILEKDINEFNS